MEVAVGCETGVGTIMPLWGCDEPISSGEPVLPDSPVTYLCLTGVMFGVVVPIRFMPLVFLNGVLGSTTLGVDSR
jgi:hypothetical protein